MASGRKTCGYCGRAFDSEVALREHVKRKKIKKMLKRRSELEASPLHEGFSAFFASSNSTTQDIIQLARKIGEQKVQPAELRKAIEHWETQLDDIDFVLERMYKFKQMRRMVRKILGQLKSCERNIQVCLDLNVMLESNRSDTTTTEEQEG
ncbi:hypothetical protein QR680_006859 [Steinernema hermaphroditum]|uniref:Uncharacterized protein n=1 Tax=Steinernema hermaphroditum TaxID=289476 RepID=A0AA39LXS6_9BILA|nr:hypothetical protein QR680_006859 [Steinernema hermaphroditum]